MAAPIFSSFDVCRPLQKQNVIGIIHQLLKEGSKAIDSIIQKEEQLEKPDIDLIDLLKGGKESSVDDLKVKLCQYINEIKYRKAGKPYNIFQGISDMSTGKDLPNNEAVERPKGCFQFSKPCCLTEKLDGTQIQIGFIKGQDEFYMLSHSGNGIVDGKKLITTKDLEPAAKPGHTTIRYKEFQKGNLTNNFLPLIPQMRQLMKDFGLKEAWFYFELTFAAGTKTPKQLPYFNDEKKMNKCYLFGMSYNLYDEAGVPSHIVKLSVNPETKPLFAKYKLPMVPILYHTESFQQKNFEEILKICNVVDIEGGVFCQPDCYLKILLTYYTETLKTFEIADFYGHYAELQSAYKAAIQSRPKKEKQPKKDKLSINKALIIEELDKELSKGHKGWLDALTHFYGIPNDKSKRNTLREYIASSVIVVKVKECLAESNDFKDILEEKKVKNEIINVVMCRLIERKKAIKAQYEISISTKS